MELVQQVAENITRHRLLRRGDGVVVAVSGGLDSVVLLHVLHGMAADNDWRLHVAHFHHGLRGRDSTLDQTFTKHLARKLSLPWICERGNVKAWARARGLSVEMAARDLRHAFLAKTALVSQCKTVALAHHADDQVELFLLRLLRGAGSEGLSGMRWKNPSPADSGIRLIRPLMDAPKEALAAYAREHQLKHREDASNRSDEFLRNRVRQELIPLLEGKYQPGLRQVILRQMELLRAESDFVAAQAMAWARTPSDPDFMRWPVAIQREHLRRALRTLGVTPGFDGIEALRNADHRPVTITEGRAFSRDHRGRVWEVNVQSAGFSTEERPVRLRDRKKDIRFGGLRLRWSSKRLSNTVLPDSQPDLEWFDADRLGENITLRHWREGDRFQPIGMKRSVKLQDWFTNQKIPKERRRTLVVAATSEGEIWWVQDSRIGERFKVTARTKRLLRWTWKRVVT